METRAAVPEPSALRTVKLPRKVPAVASVTSNTSGRAANTTKHLPATMADRVAGAGPLLLRALAAVAVMAGATAAAVTPPAPRYPGERIVFYDEFDQLSLDTWRPEVSMSGYGSWSFEQYGNTRSNLYVRNGVAYLRPTLMTETGGLSEAQIVDGYTHDISGSDPASMCTAPQYWGCMRTSGGANIINPSEWRCSPVAAVVHACDSILPPSQSPAPASRRWTPLHSSTGAWKCGPSSPAGTLPPP